MAYVKIRKTEKSAQPSWLDQLLDTSMGLAKVFDFQESQPKKDFIDFEMADSGHGSPVHADNETSEGNVAFDVVTQSFYLIIRE